jgi:hypothetical protein
MVPSLKAETGQNTNPQREKEIKINKIQTNKDIYRYEQINQLIFHRKCRMMPLWNDKWQLVGEVKLFRSNSFARKRQIRGPTIKLNRVM